MAGNHAELGKSFLTEVFGKLPDALRANAEQLLSSPEAQAALETVGSRVSPLDEERQRLTSLKTQLDGTSQKLTAWRGNLETWARTKEDEFTERERKLAERRTTEPAPEGDPPPNAAGDSVTKENLAKTIGEFVAPREAAFVQYVADATNFSTFHLKHFNEPLDVATIVRHPEIGNLGFRGVYEQLHKEKLDKMQSDAKAAERAAIKDEVRKELIGERPVDMPYPIAEGSPLDALALATDKRPSGDPAAAARMYEQLVSSGANR